MLTRLLELRRHGDLRLLESVLLAPEPAVVIDDPVPAIGTALHLDLEPALPAVRHSRRPQRALRILRLPFDRHTARDLPAILGSFVDRAERRTSPHAAWEFQG